MGYDNRLCFFSPSLFYSLLSLPSPFTCFSFPFFLFLIIFCGLQPYQPECAQSCLIIFYNFFQLLRFCCFISSRDGRLRRSGSQQFSLFTLMQPLSSKKWKKSSVDNRKIKQVNSKAGLKIKTNNSVEETQNGNAEYEVACIGFWACQWAKRRVGM